MQDDNYLYHYYALPCLDEMDRVISLGYKKEIIDFIVYGNKSKGSRKHKLSLNEQPYLNINRLKSIIKDKKIWISRVECFNDPMEFISYFSPELLLKQYFPKNTQLNQDDLKQFYDSSKQYNGWIPFRHFEGKTYYGVYCFTKNATCPLMWGYYASNHTGICIRFKVNDQIKKIINSDRMVSVVKYTIGPGLILGKVSYSEEPFKVTLESVKKYRNEYEKIKQNTSDIKISFEDYISIISTLTKFNKWHHEEEFRLICLGLEKNVSLAKLVEPYSQIPYFYPDAIIFGFKTSEHAKQIIRKFLGESISYYNLTIDYGKYVYKVVQ